MSTVAVSTGQLQSWDQLKSFLRWGKIALSALAGLAIFFLILETARMYQTLSAIHPLAGVAGLIGVGLALALVIAPAYRYFRMPRAVEPPPLPPEGQLNHQSYATEARYLDRYLANCQRNPAFDSQKEAIQLARRELDDLITGPASHEPLAKRIELLTQWSTTRMNPAMAAMDERVDRLIYQEALGVGLATAASPNGVLDAYVMLWRSVRLVSEISVLYYGRPGVRGTLAICRDVSLAVATAGYMQTVSDSLGNAIARTIGGAGGLLAGPAVDGITNAVVLVRIGQLAKARCRSYRRWDESARKNAILSTLSATHKFAVGITSEILRQAGSGVSAVAGKLAKTVGEYGSHTKQAAGRFAEGAIETAGVVAGEAFDAAGKFTVEAAETVSYAASEAAKTASWVADQASQKAKSASEAISSVFGLGRRADRQDGKSTG